MVQAREQELVEDLKDERLAALTQWQEAAEEADAKVAAQVAQVLCLNLHWSLLLSACQSGFAASSKKPACITSGEMQFC